MVITEADYKDTVGEFGARGTVAARIAVSRENGLSPIRFVAVTFT